MTNSSEKPLITFALYAYNQERFIREAVEGAFSQIYTPLEIILSDDCSTDLTYEIIKEMASDYAGPHKIIINRNAQNRGIGGHVNRMMHLAKGELIVGAAGDDISLPERTNVLYQEWMLSGKRCKSLFSNLYLMDEFSNIYGKYFNSTPIYIKNIPEFISTPRCWVAGCSQAYEKSLFDIYGPIDARIIQEDGAISFRAILKGNIKYIDKCLVKYRRHSSNVYQPNNISSVLLLLRKEYYFKRSWLKDALLTHKKEIRLIQVLKKESRKAYFFHIIFNLPLIGKSILHTKKIIKSIIRRKNY
jgi:glycosyltransferase involved in cell wall biosynthesis